MCRKCANERILKTSRGVGRDGLIGRMRRLLAAGKVTALSGNYLPIKSSPEELLEVWKSQEGVCECCGDPLEILDSHADHDHDTGRFRGFVHPKCNLIIGLIENMSKERFTRVIMYKTLASVMKAPVAQPGQSGAL